MVRNNRQIIYRHTQFILAMVLTIFLSATATAADIQVSTDRNPVGPHESFQLTFSASGSVDDDPDFTPLKNNFQILSTSKSSNISIINGKTSSNETWVLTVLPRQEGKLTIPAIAFGRDRSPVSSITVSGNASSGNIIPGDDKVFIKVEVSEHNPYVQSQVIYTVRIFTSLSTASASLSDPEISDGTAIVERIDEDKNYQTSIKGKTYMVVERNYAIYPQSSGKVTIGPVQFQGQLVSNAFSLFDPFRPGIQQNMIARQSDPVVLEVRPVPAGFSGPHWLPARNLSITEEWSQNPPQFMVGGPITRTLSLTANGLSAGQLPELPAWQPPEFKLYPDQPVLNDNKTAKGITGQRQEKTAIIPNQQGNYVIPAMTIPWWNIVTDKEEYATLPERHIVVSGLPEQTAQNNNAIEIQPSAPSEPAKPEANNAPQPGQTPAMEALPLESKTGSYWQWLTLLFAVGWTITGILWWKSRRATRQGQDSEPVHENIKVIMKELKQACFTNNPTLAKDKLLQWSRIYWPDSPPVNLGEIARRSEGNLHQEIYRLNNSLYGKHAGNWTGATLWESFSKEWPKKDNSVKIKQGKLEPLYKL